MKNKLDSGNYNKSDTQTFFFQPKLKKKIYKNLNEAKIIGVLKRRHVMYNLLG